MNTTRAIAAGCLFALGVFAWPAKAGTFDVAHYLYVGSDPLDERLDWSDNVQGIGHDATHWYIARLGRLWRVPVSVDLGALRFNTPGVSHVLTADVPELVADGYDHCGDLVCYEHDGNGYVIVPIEALPDRAGIAVFRADATLAYVDHINLFPGPESRQSHWSWVAVDPEGRLYGSNFDDVDHLVRYQVDWAQLDATDERLISNETAEEILLDGGSLVLSKVQGGELTPEASSPELPFRTITGALGLAWEGAEIRTRTGIYPELLTIGQCVRISATGGLVRIGG